MGHIPVGMEMFSAADEEQWEIIARHIAESDFYLVVLAHKYGSELSDGMSYTRKEYEHAASVKIPILGFPIKESAAWPGDRRETDHSASRSLADHPVTSSVNKMQTSPPQDPTRPRVRRSSNLPRQRSSVAAQGSIFTDYESSTVD